MAIKKVIELVVEGGEAAKEIKKLFDESVKAEKELQKQAEKTNDAIEDQTEALSENAKELEKAHKEAREELEKVEKQTKQNKKATFSLTGGFKALGGAIKATGIGLVVAAVAGLTQAFLKNEKVAKTLEVVMETIGVALSTVVDALVNAFESANEATGGFDALGKVIDSLITLQLTPIKLIFFAIKKALIEAQLAWEKSFLGGNDKERIKELEADLKEVNNDLIEVADKAVEAGKTLVSSFGEAMTEIGELGKSVVEETSKISGEAIKEQAKLNVELRNSAQIAAAQQARLVEQYDRQAEKLRQIRDNDLASIADRKKANNELAEVLEMQEKAMIRQANLQVAAAQNEFNQNKSTENRIALIDALANKEGVLAQIEGFRSEQKTNAIALEKEELELNQSLIDAKAERALKESEFLASQEENTMKRLELEREAIAQEKAIEEERLNNRIESLAQGTQARVDAEIELADKLQEIRFRELENEQEINKQRIADEKAVADAKKAIQDAQIDNALGGIKLLSQVFGKSKALQGAAVVAENVAGIAKTIINTQAANSAAVLKYAALPGGQALAASEIAANKISAGISIGTSIAATAKALSQLGGGGGGVASSGGAQNLGGGGGASDPQAPAFNLIGQGGGINQIQESLQQEQQPIQTFVVSGNVTSAQELERNIINEASI